MTWHDRFTLLNAFTANIAQLMDSRNCTNLVNLV